MREIQAQQNYLPIPLSRAKGISHKNDTSNENQEEQKLYESRTTLRTHSKRPERCKMHVQGQ